MTKRNFKLLLPVALAGGLLALSAVGCELIASVDRDKIDQGGAGGAGATGGAGGGTTTGGGGIGGGGGPVCDPATCPGADTDCAKRACDANDACITENVAQDTACTYANNPDAKVCDGQGTCVECNTTTDCTSTDVCDQNQCVPVTCTDQTQNGTETDVDCGGQDCVPCANTKMCDQATDCTSGFCDTSGGGGGGGPAGVCAACSDETDCQTQEWCDTADAGGTCKAQSADGLSCGADIECLNGHCPGDDGVCCDTACGALCAACQASKTGGTDGTCAPVTGGSDPDTECGSDTCDGAGDCAVCGDGTKQATETCDDGGTDACGPCNATCTGAGTGSTCGDGTVCPDSETCDDGGTDACGPCNATCTAAGTGSTCGDGTVCPDSETCDDGGTDACGPCNATCTAAGTGSTCGDGTVCPDSETCDDYNNLDCGSCNATCGGAGTGTCGDGVGCAVSADCTSNNCVANVCSP